MNLMNFTYQQKQVDMSKIKSTHTCVHLFLQKQGQISDENDACNFFKNMH